MLACLGVFKDDVIQKLYDLTSRHTSHSDVTAGRTVNTKTSIPTNSVQLVLDPLLTLSRHPSSVIGPWINEAFVDLVCHVTRVVPFKDTTYLVRNKTYSIIKNVGAMASIPLLNKLVGTLEQMDGPKDLLKSLRSRLETVNTSKQSSDQAATDSESATEDEQL